MLQALRRRRGDVEGFRRLADPQKEKVKMPFRMHSAAIEMIREATEMFLVS